MENEKITIVNYRDEFAESLSYMIIRNLLEVNSKDYSIEEMKRHSLSFAPDKIREYSTSRTIFVALADQDPVGTLSVAKDVFGEENDFVFLTVFVLPEFHNMGIGRDLMKTAENFVRENKGRKINIPSSVTAHEFYYKLGFDYMNGSKQADSRGIIMMTKVLSAR